MSAEEIKQKVLSDPKWRQLFQLFSDKQLAISVLRKRREMFMDENNHQRFEEGYDPENVDGLVNFSVVLCQLEREVMEKCGLGEYVKDIANLNLLKCIVPLYMNDPEACVLSGSLVKLFRDYQDKVEFLCVYLAEAHPKEMWSFGPRFCFMEQHKTLQDRIQAAQDMIAIDSVHNTFTTNLDDKSKMRLVIDPIDNAFAMAYNAHPDRVFVIDTEDRIAFCGRNIAVQLDEPQTLMTDEIRNWLEKNIVMLIK